MRRLLRYFMMTFLTVQVLAQSHALQEQRVISPIPVLTAPSDISHTLEQVAKYALKANLHHQKEALRVLVVLKVSFCRTLLLYPLSTMQKQTAPSAYPEPTLRQSLVFLVRPAPQEKH